MNFEFNSSYFFKLAEWIINSEPGVFEVEKLSKEPERFKNNILWYNISRPREFNRVIFISDNQIEIVKEC